MKNKKPHRIAQLAELITHRLNEAITRELALPQEIIVSVTKTHVSSDKRFAKAGISIYPDSERDKIFALICRNLKQLKHATFHDMNFKFIPELKVYIDLTEKEQHKLDVILETLRKKYNSN